MEAEVRLDSPQALDFRAIGVAVVPTVLLVDAKGTIKQGWSGVLSPGQIREVEAAAAL